MPDAWNASRMAGSLDSARAAYVVIPAAPSASADFGPTPASWVRSSALAALTALAGLADSAAAGPEPVQRVAASASGPIATS